MMAEAAESSTAVKVLVVKVQHVLPTVISKHITNRLCRGCMRVVSCMACLEHDLHVCDGTSKLLLAEQDTRMLCTA